MRQPQGAIMVMVLMLGCLAGAGSAADQPSEEPDEGGGPALLFIQGKLKPGAEATYQEYLSGTAPLMAEYGVTAIKSCPNF